MFTGARARDFFSVREGDSACCFYSCVKHSRPSEVVKLLRWCQQNSVKLNFIYQGWRLRRCHVSHPSPLVQSFKFIFSSYKRRNWQSFLRKILSFVFGANENKWNLWKWYGIMLIFCHHFETSKQENSSGNLLTLTIIALKESNKKIFHNIFP